jgi:SAM-dependent methyltransferase
VPDQHYENLALAELYDLDSGWSEDRDFYLSLAGTPPQSILDLGCGTGLICNEYAARGHRVTGVDPANAMLQIARAKPQGAKIEWVEATAQNFKSPQKFDLIIMTGHVFQVLLNDQDILSTFATMRDHLKPNGLAAFESRNPAIDWVTRWNTDVVLKSGENSIGVSRRTLQSQFGRIRFDTSYHMPSETLISASELRFSSKDEITSHLLTSGLIVERVLGDWQGNSFDDNLSEEMIFLVRLAAELDCD